jgi:hypothetical protein
MKRSNKPTPSPTLVIRGPRSTLSTGFYETTQGMKFTIGPAARAEVLDRLLELNFERHAAEVAQGSATKKPGKAPRARPTSQTALGI